MADLIDRGALIQDLKEHKIPFNADINEAIIVAPTVDAVPVVRCKDCKYGVLDRVRYFCSADGGIWCDGDWFCANGEKREAEQR